MKLRYVLLAAAALVATPFAAQATPDDDLQHYREFFMKKFPGVPLEEFANGVYAIDATARENWEAIEEFPPYEPDVEAGKVLFETPFKNGKGYASCFPNDGIGVAQNYPMWDREKGRVVTLELAVNECREANGEKALKPFKGEIAQVLAYMAYTSRGNITNVEIPKDDPRALEAYESGKHFYFARRGQLNFSCAHCHFDNAGQLLRSDRLSPALGHTTHWPVYRAKWNELGTLDRRFKGCNEQVRAKALENQSEEYRNLEYFLAHMSNGIPLNGPGARK